MGLWLNSCGSCNTLVVLEWGKVGRWGGGTMVDVWLGNFSFLKLMICGVLAHVIISYGGVMDELFWLLLIGFFSSRSF